MAISTPGNRTGNLSGSNTEIGPQLPESLPGEPMATSNREARAVNDTLDWAHEILTLDWTEVAAAVEVDRRTICRWRRGLSAPSREQRERIDDMRELRFLLETVLPEPDVRLEWLHCSVPALRGETPVSVIKRGRVLDVMGVLAGVYSGAFD
jgi:hypothetical protein